jgi:hypothetical protein
LKQNDNCEKCNYGIGANQTMAFTVVRQPHPRRCFNDGKAVAIFLVCSSAEAPTSLPPCVQAFRQITPANNHHVDKACGQDRQTLRQKNVKQLSGCDPRHLHLAFRDPRLPSLAAAIGLQGCKSRNGGIRPQKLT